MSWGQPRSLQARQLLAASLGLVAFLALAGYALDRAFLETAESNMRQRLRSLAVDSNRVYTVDIINHRVQVFTKLGTFVLRP